MKKRIFLIALGLAVSAGCPLANAQNNEPTDSDVHAKVQQARVHAKALGGALKSRLKQAIQSGGLEAGVEECQLAAEPIAEGLSQHGWEVGRTALKVRNPNNAPDEWEREQLTLFSSLLEKTKLEGKPPSTPMDTYKYDSDSGEFRYMMAIQQGQVCMACHGAQVAPSVKETILKHYPKDEATGFELGELRGAFTLTYSPQ
ncbi:Tll0287-like domain-containing protein [Alteromonas sp. S015]|uniref:Tll0287-like domain-containing protein n=1 Tax=Alteromonas sp. S015 TaxID=3117401 RepID=UPI002FE26F3D